MKNHKPDWFFVAVGSGTVLAFASVVLYGASEFITDLMRAI